jgi:hypothetical protein
MRRLTLFMVIFLLLASASTAFGGSVASGDGSLVVSSASARLLVVYGNGLIFGHINQGTLTIVDYHGGDPSSVQVSGSVLKLQSGSGTQYSGSDIRFLFPNGHYTLRFDGVGIDISAVGKGSASAIGVGSADDGSMGTNGGKGVPLGPTPTTLVFGASKAPNYVPSAVGKGSAH